MSKTNTTEKRPKPQFDAKALKRLLAYMVRGNKLKFLIVIVCIIISSLVGVIGSMFIEIVIDDYISPLLLEAQPVFTGLLKAIFVMMFIYLIGALSTYVYSIIMVNISQGVLKDIRDELFKHMQTLPIKYFDTHSHGDLMSLYTNDTDTLRQMICQSIPSMISGFITIVSVFIAMLSMNLILTAFIVLCVIGMLFVTRTVAKKSGTYFVKQQKNLANINGFIEEMIGGQKVIKVFCYEDKTKEDFNKLNDELLDSAYNANKFANILMPLMHNMGNLQYILLALVGGFMAIAGVGGLTLGTIAAFLQLSKSFTMPISQFSQQLNFIVMSLAGAKRIFAAMDEKPEYDDGYVLLVNANEKDGVISESDKVTGMWAWKHPHNDGSTTYTKLKGDVQLFDVNFEYERDKLILREISLKAKSGEKFAFVGATGAGKTTITNLINRFYDISDGKIRYDGININKIKKSSLRRSLGIVLQDTNLFTGTVRENIRYGKPDATDEEVYISAKLANAHGFIKRLEHGYDTLLNGAGAELSQGQRQLISIARAAVANPPVMILDEATSSIDTRTELIVQRGMDALMKGRTVFVIAHRLSTIQNSDTIIVLDHGKIIECGSHNELISLKGDYYRLYTGAFELE